MAREGFSEKGLLKSDLRSGELVLFRESVVHVGMCTSRAEHSSVALTALLTATDHGSTVFPC